MPRLVLGLKEKADRQAQRAAVGTLRDNRVSQRTFQRYVVAVSMFL